MGKIALPLMKVFANMVFVLAAVAVSGPEVVSAQTHHVVGGEEGWSSASNISSWLSGRIFRVGDKLLFSFPATEETVVELQSLEELASCDLRNPISMYTDGSNHVILDKEGTRYFSSGNLENCKSGMKLPVSVQNHDDDERYGPYEPYPPTPEKPHPYFPPPHPYPAAATALNVFSLAVFAGLYLSCIGV